MFVVDGSSPAGMTKVFAPRAAEKKIGGLLLAGGRNGLLTCVGIERGWTRWTGMFSKPRVTASERVLIPIANEDSFCPYKGRGLGRKN
jgi:hypothetical protein